MAKKEDPAVLKKVSVSIPFGIGSAEWESDPTERKAAWSLYIAFLERVRYTLILFPIPDSRFPTP